VSKAIYEHYLPVSLDDESPLSLPGAILSLADKLDSIVGVMGIAPDLVAALIAAGEDIDTLEHHPPAYFGVRRQ
jgi:hypothetical protein